MLGEDSVGRIRGYNNTGAFLHEFDTRRAVAPGLAAGLAVDSAQDFYLPSGCSCLVKFHLEQEQQATQLEAAETETISPVSGLAVDPTTNDLYVGLGTALVQYGPYGEPFAEPVHRSNSHLVQAGAGVAVNSTTQAVYIVDAAGNDVAILGLGTTPAAPKTDTQSKVSTSEATLNGDLNPEGMAGGIGYFFSYNSGFRCTGPGSRTTSLDNGGSNATGSSDIPESTQITGLEPLTEYTFCLVAENNDGPTYGPEVSFTTLPTPPILGEIAVSAITSSSAAISSMVDPRDMPTHWEVLAGDTPGSLTYQGAGDLTGKGAQPITVTFHDLTPGAIYRYELIANNLDGTTESSEATFTTAPGPPPPPPAHQTAPIHLPTIQWPTEEGKITTGESTPPKKLTTNQQLAKALKVCGKKPKRQRARCEKQARATYRATKPHGKRK